MDLQLRYFKVPYRTCEIWNSTSGINLINSKGILIWIFDMRQADVFIGIEWSDLWLGAYLPTTSNWNTLQIKALYWNGIASKNHDLNNPSSRDKLVLLSRAHKVQEITLAVIFTYGVHLWDIIPTEQESHHFKTPTLRYWFSPEVAQSWRF